MKRVEFLDADDIKTLTDGRELEIVSFDGNESYFLRYEERHDEGDGVDTLENSLRSASLQPHPLRLKCNICGATVGATGKPFKSVVGLAIHKKSHMKNGKKR